MSDKSITQNSTKTGNGDGARNAHGSSMTRSDISLKDDVKGLGSDVKGIASDVAKEAQKLAESRLDTGKGLVAEGIGSVAGALRSTGDQLRESPVGPVSGYLGSAADSIQEAGKYLENKSVGEVVSDVESFARREPLIFLGGTFAVGLLLGRFLKSSSPERRSDRGRYDAPPPARREMSREPSTFTSASSAAPPYGQGSAGSMGGTTTGGNMGAGKLPSFETPLTAGPITTGPITQGPVSTRSSVGTDLPVEAVADAITPLRTTGATADPPSLGEKKPTSVIGSSGPASTLTGGTTTSSSGDVKKTHV